MTRVTNAELARYHKPKQGDQYKAQHVTFKTSDGRVFHFDSRWELDVFRLIRPFSVITEIHKDYRIEVLPKTLHFPPRNWKLDFRLIASNGSVINLECKSAATAMHADFRRTLENISYFHPHEFERLLVVFPNSCGKQLPKVSTYLRVPIYPQGLFKGACLLTASDLQGFLGALGRV